MKLNIFEKIIIVLLTLFVLVLLTIGVAKSQDLSKCRSYKEAHNFLLKGAKETPIFNGLSVAGHLIVLYFNSETGTWTALSIPPVEPKIMCVVDHGTDSFVKLSVKERDIEFNN
jgi:hypothetical protein